MISSKKWILSGLVALAMLFTGCILGDEDDDAVEITLSSTNASTTVAGQNIPIDGKISGPGALTIQYEVTSADANANVSRITVSANAPGTNNSVDMTDDLVLTIQVPATACNATYLMTITATSGSATSSKAHTFSVTGGQTCTGGTPMAQFTNGVVANIYGPAEGAFDIVSGARVTGLNGATAPQDILDASTAGNGLGRSWTSGNGTMFMKVTGYDYANATVESATAAFTAPAASVSSIANGDIIILKLRGGSTYSVVQITNVDPANPTSGAGNPGSISFNYKK